MAGEAFGLGRPEVKGRLAALGQTMQPDAELQTYHRPRQGENVSVVVLERVTEGVTPEYCTHGYASCVSCDELCWLGDETEKVVASRRAYPMCLDCARKLLPKDLTPSEHLEDHRRASGPHD